MRRRCTVPLVGGLVRHQPVALHDLPRHLGVAAPGRVRHDEPALRLRLPRCFAHGVVVGAGDPAHLRAIAGDRVHPTLAYALVDEDHAATVEALRAPGHGAAVIAVGGAGDGDPLGGAPVAACCQIGRARLRRHAATRQFGGQHGGHRVGAAERLEAAEAEAGRLVLQPDDRHAGLRRAIAGRSCNGVIA